LKEDMTGRVLVVAATTGDVDRLLIRSDDFETCRSRVNDENGARAEWGRERLIAGDFRFCEPGETAGKQSRTCDGTDESHDATYADFAAIVPESAAAPWRCAGGLAMSALQSKRPLFRLLCSILDIRDPFRRSLLKRQPTNRQARSHSALAVVIYFPRSDDAVNSKPGFILFQSRVCKHYAFLPAFACSQNDRYAPVARL
jgi:hypothetical protein